MVENKCPKCGEKLSIFYLKQECPKCKVNLLYYDLENRLESDRIKAEKEHNAVVKFLDHLKMSTFGGVLQIIRFILFFTPLLWMLLPVFSIRIQDNSLYKFTLQGVIIGFIKGNLNFDLIFNDKAYLLPILTMILVILFSLAVIISSLFSCGEKSLVRNTIFSAVNFIVLTVMTLLCTKNGIKTDIGLYIIFTEYIITFAMHVLCDKKIRLNRR